MSRSLLGLATSCGLFLLGCGAPPTPAECDALLTRYAETLVDRERPGLSRGVRERLIAEAIAASQASPAFRRCPQAVSQRSLQCARDAFDPDQIERCLIDVP